VNYTGKSGSFEKQRATDSCLYGILAKSQQVSFVRGWRHAPRIGAFRRLATLLVCGMLVYTPGASTQGADHYAAARAAMVEHLQYFAQAPELGERQLDPAVLEAMGRVPRHLFVPERLRDQAYENYPLPIGHGQTISQPYIVALMTDLLNVAGNDVVLEVGTGSGYQAAVLAELARHVYTIEIVQPLGRQATTRIGDGYHGWEEHAPFDAIMVTAGAHHVPPPLVRQLKPGGKMIIPVSTDIFTQHLLLVKKTQAGAVETRQVLPVRFVPLTRDH
jgi:protein-L-isoaspartate(D-aspartate) O-methyltransferase